LRWILLLIGGGGSDDGDDIDGEKPFTTMLVFSNNKMLRHVNESIIDIVLEFILFF